MALRLTEEMFKCGKPVAQGEVVIWMKKYAPVAILKAIDGHSFKEMKLEHDQMILGHSETGHHHVLEAVRPKTKITKAAQVLIDEVNDAFCEIRMFEECQLTHLRSHDTHGALIFPAGEYIRFLREEQSPEGWRRVAD